MMCLLATRAQKNILNQLIDENKFKRIFCKLYEALTRMESSKYLNPKYADTLISLAEVVAGNDPIAQ